jgi:CheY-like chemotaxis protein
MSNPEPKSQRPILLAEDEDTDAIMFQLALKRSGLAFPVIVARDGQEAVDYLSARDPTRSRSDHPMPALIVLDLKMPRMTGFEVLSWLRSQPGLQQIPAVVLSSSSYPRDIQQATELGAREYFIKPHSLAELSRVLQIATDRWLPSERGSL